MKPEGWAGRKKAGPNMNVQPRREGPPFPCRLPGCENNLLLNWLIQD
jgi:hypothetical protein